MRARVSLVAVFALAAMLVGSESAAACSCAPISPKKLLKGADGAFNGRLLSVKPAEGTTEAAFRYRVGVVAKGPFRRGRVVTVWSQNSDSVCGLIRGPGKVYGLFVSRDEERWAGGLCAMTSPKATRRLARDVDSASSTSVSSGSDCP